MTIRYIVLGVLLFTSIEANTHVLKIDNLVEIALKHSPDIDSRKFDFEAAQQRSISARGFYLPQLDLGVNGGKTVVKTKKSPSR